MRRDALPHPLLDAPAAHTSAQAERAAVGATLLAILVTIAGYWPTAATMAQTWARSDTFAHGFVVPPITAWLIWRQRSELREVGLKPHPAMLLGVALVGACWLLGQFAQVNALRQFALVALAILAVPAICGIALARRIAFPLAFLLFAVPFGEFLLPKLMDWTAFFTVAALRVSGIPVYQEGLRFVIPSGSWSVVEACSGVRYLIASFMVGTLYGYLTYHSTRRRIVFAAVALAVPIVANWIRAYVIVLLGHLSSNRLAVGVDHLIYGWVFFGLVMLVMFWLGARWREDYPAATAPAPVAGTQDTGGAGQFWVAAAAFVAIALAPVALQHVVRAPERAGVPAWPTLDPLGPWRASSADVTAWRPQFNAPSAERFTTYLSAGRAVGLHVAVYRNQTENRKLVSSENTLVKSDDPQWSRIAEGTQAVVLAGADPIHVITTTVQGAGGDRLRVWQWYWVDGDMTSSPIWAKLLQVRAQFARRSDDAAAIVIVTPMRQAPDAPRDADAVLAAFARDAAGSVDAALRALRDHP